MTRRSPEPSRGASSARPSRRRSAAAAAARSPSSRTPSPSVDRTVPRGFLSCLLLPGDDDHARAMPEQCAGARETEPPRAAGDERCPPFETESTERHEHTLVNHKINRPVDFLEFLAFTYERTGAKERGHGRG